MNSGTRVLVLEDDVERVYDAGNETEQGETDVDQQIATTSLLSQHAQRGQDDGKDDLADVRTGERHCWRLGLG